MKRGLDRRWGWLLLAALPLLPACSNLAYYAQAVGGHWQLMQAARPIPEWLADPATEPGLKQQLGEIQALREFASRELALPDNGSYKRYADLKRPFVVWNVFAAEEFSIAPRQWCLLLVGCVNYRGYYDQKDAEALARQLRSEGLETWVGGVPAYSTLGYFDDPVLNTFLRYGQNEVARTLFHELAHQKVFVTDDTAFNESFATALEEVAMERWMAAQGKPERILAFREQQARKTRFVALVQDYREQLGRLYNQKSMAPEDLRTGKARIIADLRRAYAELKTSWGGHGGYDFWFSGPLNNAQLAPLSLYNHWVPAFHALLKQENGDLPRFYARVRELADKPKAERQEILHTLSSQ